jgi:Icc protein
VRGQARGRARIVQLTDLHLTARAGRAVRGADVWANLARTLAHVTATQEPFGLLVLSGDLAKQRQAATYERLHEWLQPFAGRVRVLPGNHDSRRLLRASFGALLPPAGPLCFRVELAGWTVLGLDSVRRPFVHGRFGRAQLQWLDRELQAAPGPALAFVHHPPIAVGAWWLDKDRPRDRRRLQALLAGSPLRALFCGHVHQEHAGTFATVPVWTTPAVAYQFRPRSIWPAVDSRAPGYRVVDLDGGSLTTASVAVPAGQ